jgi:uncharacterized membrane protein YkoI
MKTPRLLKYCLALLLLASASAQAGWHARPVPARAEARGGRIVVAQSGVSLQQAKAMAERRFKAKVISEETRQEGDRKIYVLRLLNDKESWVVRVDASTGAMSPSSR